MRFQERHGLLADGIAGARTFQMLNIPLDEKIRRIRALILRLRTVDWRRESYLVRIIIPAFELQVIRNGAILRTHRVVVGNRNPIRLDPENKREVPERYNTTPVFSGMIETVIFNPPWSVPERIKDELDRTEIRKDPDYLEKNDFVVVTDEDGNERYYQEGGSQHNALGQVKILFPNPYSVYMHDTPMRGLFQRANRDFSHGCIRVQDALGLARFLLAEDGNPKTAQVDAILADPKHTVWLPLRRRVPIHIEYDTVSADGEGNVFFYEDLYNYAGEGAPVAGKRRL
jgi:L,D-transpeptidase YcbB